MTEAQVTARRLCVSDSHKIDMHKMLLYRLNPCSFKTLGLHSIGAGIAAQQMAEKFRPKPQRVPNWFHQQHMKGTYKHLKESLM